MEAAANLNGLWTAEFGSPDISGAGVVVFQDGKIYGGDNSYYYIGDYRVNGLSISATLQIIHYHGPRNSIFGLSERYSLNLRGSTEEDLIMAQGYDADRPSLKAFFRLQRVAQEGKRA